MKGFRTITFNVLATAVPILELTEFRDVLPDVWLPWYALGVALANMYLRYITTTALGQKD